MRRLSTGETDTRIYVDALTNTIIRKGYSPYVDPETSTWWAYDHDTKEFVDTRLPSTPYGYAVNAGYTGSEEEYAASMREAAEFIADVITGAYSSDQVYSVGDLALWEGKLYKCLVVISEPEEFDPEHWTQTRLTAEIAITNGYTIVEVNTLLDTKKDLQSAVSDPEASGTAVSFIDSVSQNTQGIITATKKTVRNATTSQSGLMSAADKTAVDALGNASTLTYTVVSTF